MKKIFVWADDKKPTVDQLLHILNVEAEGIETRIVFAETLGIKKDDNYMEELVRLRNHESLDELRSFMDLIIVNPMLDKPQCVEIGQKLEKDMCRNIKILFLEDIPNGN